MRRAVPRPRPTFLTVSEVQAGPHYASHVDQPNGARRLMTPVSGEEMDRLVHSCDPATARGVPAHFDYSTGTLRVWPWPAEGWQVWAQGSGRNVTP